jgi:hypothetical protein
LLPSTLTNSVREPSIEKRLVGGAAAIIYMTKQPLSATGARTGRRYSDLVARVVSELRGLNFEFEHEEDAAERIIDLVLTASSKLPALDRVS